MKCNATDCEAGKPDTKEGLLCDSCLSRMDTLMREELTKRIGRVATQRDVDELIDRILAKRPN